MVVVVVVLARSGSPLESNGIAVQENIGCLGSGRGHRVCVIVLGSENFNRPLHQILWRTLIACVF